MQTVSGIRESARARERERERVGDDFAAAIYLPGLNCIDKVRTANSKVPALHAVSGNTNAIPATASTSKACSNMLFVGDML